MCEAEELVHEWFPCSNQGSLRGSLSALHYIDGKFRHSNNSAVGGVVDSQEYDQIIAQEFADKQGLKLCGVEVGGSFFKIYKITAQATGVEVIEYYPLL